jgi:coenzyme F420-0:L-glutamate ligase / coenzyme F420-1:gamma-L-glutamate ligase
MSSTLQLVPLRGFPLVEPGDNLADQIIHSIKHNRLVLEDGDLLAIAQKIVSKSENQYRLLKDVNPGKRAFELAEKVAKDPAFVQCVLDESQEVLRYRPGVLIVRHRNGYVHANAGIDQSNIQFDDDNPKVLLLPKDPDKSAARLRSDIQSRTGISVNVLINDSAGRPWRNGIAGFAIGTAGFEAIDDRIGHPDLYGKELQVTQIAIADELAAAASIVMGQGDEGVPVVLVKGARLLPAAGGSGSLIRDPALDLFL